jgi:uncharacterized membrane protein
MKMSLFGVLVVIIIATISTGFQVEWGHWGVAIVMALGIIGACSENVTKDANK